MNVPAFQRPPRDRNTLSSAQHYNGLMAAHKLTDTELASLQVPGWTVQDAKLHRDFKFPDFAHAFGFMATAAILIEKMNHHPEWLNVYNRVSVDLTTHDSGGITDKDVELAKLLDSIAAKLV
jgi:4a-hydroxytetrahydrobiopterin dehydratase